jgi:hypothetical protein
MITILIVAAVVIIGGIAGWYFKIHRPKQHSSSSEDEYEPHISDPGDTPDDWDEEQFNAEYDLHWKSGSDDYEPEPEAEE